MYAERLDAYIQVRMAVSPSLVIEYVHLFTKGRLTQGAFMVNKNCVR